jgi:hypothetical protein
MPLGEVRHISDYARLDSGESLAAGGAQVGSASHWWWRVASATLRARISVRPRTVAACLMTV